MQFNKILLTTLLLFSFTTIFSQLKGKAKHLQGTWVYAKGSGYEVWAIENGQLIGAGYRTNKIGDTVKVEQLGIKLTNNSLIYTLETGIQNFNNSAYTKYQFMSKVRKLDFTNIENALPNHLEYTFGFFNKNKLTITIWMDESVKKTKLELRKKV
ncbi:MAG: hypothetical protein QNL60_06945 [Flavobacteriales bacterium]|jgi:hypothetical protein